MRKQKLVLMLVMFLCVGNLFAQRVWQWQNPSPTGQVLLDCKFVNANTVFIVGEAGTVLKSTDAGASWTCKNPTIYNLRKIHIVNPNLIFVGGDAATVLKTTNLGETWVDISFGSDPIGEKLSGISFINENTGVIVGLNIGRTTTNGGVSWNYMGAPTGFSDIKCIGATTFIATADNAGSDLYRTTNSGVNWFAISSGGGLLSFSFTNNNTGYAVGRSGKVLKSTNGGNSWSDVSTSTINWQRMKFYDEQSAVGISDNLVYTTTNGGTNWIANFSFPGGGTTTKLGVDINENKNSLVIGMNGLLVTSPDCISWVQRNKSITSGNIIKAVGLPDGSIIAAASNGVIKSSDNGINWSIIAPANIPNDIQFINNNTGWMACGFNPPVASQGYLFKTTDGGYTWAQNLYNPTNQFTGVYFLNESTGYLFSTGVTGAVTRKTTNGGVDWVDANWSVQSIRTAKFFGSDSIMVASGNGNHAFIYFSSNAGANWINRTPEGYHADFTDIQFTNNSIGYASYNQWNSSSYSGIIHTTNCGELWLIKHNNLSSGINSIKIINQTIFAVGSNLTYTTNKGSTWVRDVIPTNYNLKYFYVSSDNTQGLLFGDNGTVLRCSPLAVPIGITQNSNITPDKFSLSQNYPNPFNPSTRINYEMRNAGFVTLKVFDLLGKEVATLVNEKQSAGSYAVDFNSSEFSLPSGIYFYTLNAGEFTETRKMVLIK